MSDIIKEFIYDIPLNKFLENDIKRKIVIWGKGAIGKKLVEVMQKKGYKISYIIDRQTDSAYFHEIKVKTPDWLLTTKEKFYCIIATRQYQPEIESFLKTIGYKEITDYLFLFHKPMVIKQDEPYTDLYGNKIVAKKGMTISITAYNSELSIYSEIESGVEICICNSKLVINENVFFEEGISIYCHSNCNLYFGANNYFQAGFQSVCYNNSTIYIGNGNIFDYGWKLSCCDDSQITIGDSCHMYIYASLCSMKKSSLFIGNRCLFQRFFNCSSSFEGNITIEDEFMASLNVSLYANDGHPIYDVKSLEQINRNKKIYISPHVWVGIKSTILSGADIGSSCIIGANSVVNKKFPNNCTIAGIPAKIIGKDVTWEITEKNFEEIDKKYWIQTEI